MRTPRRSRGPSRAAASVLCSMDQLLVGQPFADRGLDQAVKPCERVPVAVALVEPERELVYVAAQMLTAGVMVDSRDATLEHGEHGLNAIGRDVAAYVLAAPEENNLVSDPIVASTNTPMA